MRIDAHHHVWDLAVRDQPWIVEQGLQPLLRDFSLADLIPVARASGVDRSVLVQTVPVLDETPELLALAAGEDFVAGVVGWVELDSPTLEADLARHLEQPGADKLVGVRALAQYRSDPDWLARPDVVAGLRRVGGHGLTCDLLTVPGQLPAVLQAVRACPDVQFVLDHLSKPDVAGRRLAQWDTLVAPLASPANLSVKLSGLLTQTAPDGNVHDLQPYVDRALELFGPERLLAGTDWPVSLLAASYPTVLEVTDSLLAALSSDERDQVWSRTARRCYRLQTASG